MRDKDKRIIEENMDKLEITVKVLFAKFNIPKSEEDDYRQMGYLALCNKTYKYDGSTKFITFANKVMTNAFIDKYRQNKSKNAEVISIDDVYAEDESGNGTSLIDFLATGNDTENEALTRVTNDLVKKYIKNAKDKCTAKTTIKGFKALELKLEGYSGEEIAGMFNVPSNSLRSWISRAKKLLLAENEFVKAIME